MINLFTCASCKITKGHQIVADSEWILEDTFSTESQVAELPGAESTQVIKVNRQINGRKVSIGLFVERSRFWLRKSFGKKVLKPGQEFQKKYHYVDAPLYSSLDICYLPLSKARKQLTWSALVRSLPLCCIGTWNLFTFNLVLNKPIGV